MQCGVDITYYISTWPSRRAHLFHFILVDCRIIIFTILDLHLVFVSVLYIVRKHFLLYPCGAVPRHKNIILVIASCDTSSLPWSLQSTAYKSFFVAWWAIIAIPLQLSLLLACTLAIGRKLAPSQYDEKGTNVVASCNMTYNLWLLHGHHTFATCPCISWDVRICVVFAHSLAMRCKKCGRRCSLIAIQTKKYHRLCRNCFLWQTVCVSQCY